jgi:hypothetical protein
MPSPIYDHHIFVGDLTKNERAVLDICHAAIRGMSTDQLRTVAFNVQKFGDGCREHGALVIGRDRKHWTRERAKEHADAGWYSVMEILADDPAMHPLPGDEE